MTNHSVKTMLTFITLIAALCASSLACVGWSEAEMPENLHCNTDYNNQIRCEYKRDIDARCVFYFKYKSRRLNHTFVGLMERSTTRSVFYPDDGSTYVFQSFQKYNVEIDCEGVKYSGVFKPSCAIVTDAPTVSCEIGTCVFEARSHERLIDGKDVTYKYRIRSVLGDWSDLHSINGPATGLTVDINDECDRLMSTLAVDITDVRMEIEVSVWYTAETGHTLFNTEAIYKKHTWRP